AECYALAFAAEKDFAGKGVVGERLGARIAGGGTVHDLATDCGAGNRGAWSRPPSTDPGRNTQDAAAFPDIRLAPQSDPQCRCRRVATESETKRARPVLACGGVEFPVLREFPV